ncbi:hypothetical protein ABID21_004184 [Pseudorhizobium tarimense]|uniref:Uncharacterized protein n=1 Tax=Pseudorhizobium tarimense TaxID=1079109 RepID=A0ABV2HBX3_9HYPH
MNEFNRFGRNGGCNGSQEQDVASATYNCALRIRSFGTEGIMFENVDFAYSHLCQ